MNLCTPDLIFSKKISPEMLWVLGPGTARYYYTRDGETVLWRSTARPGVIQ